MTLSTRVALLLLALVQTARATTIESALRGSDENAAAPPSLPRPTRVLQLGGDLGPTIVPLVNGVLEGQVATINSNIQGAITDPIAIGETGTVNAGTISAPSTPCDGQALDFAYTIVELTGAASTLVNNVTLSSFQGLSFSTNTCQLKLADSGIRFIATGAAYLITGTMAVVDAGLCTPTTPAYTFTSTIANTIYTSVATIGFGGTTSDIELTTLELTGFSLTAGTVSTTTSPDITEDPDLGTIGQDIINLIDDQINLYLAPGGDLAIEIEGFFKAAIDGVVTTWERDGYPSTGDTQMYLADAGIVMPSRWEIAKLWAGSFFGF